MAAFGDHFRKQAEWCERLGSPFTARLLERAAESIDAEGRAAVVVSGWPGDPDIDALALRFAGALHAAVLGGRDCALAEAYPARSQDWDMDLVWSAAEAFLERDVEWVRAFMRSAPQTNEVARSGGLAPAFLWLAERCPEPFHLLELGASAGLNMNWDAYRYAHGVWGRVDGDGPVIPTVYDGVPPDWRRIDIASRAGCDLMPIDPDDAVACERLRAYVWPDQFDRHARLDAAIDLARRAPWRVEAAGAEEWLGRKLDGVLPVGTTVIYHSIFLQYPPREVRRLIVEQIETAGRAATAERQLAWVRFEPQSELGGPAEGYRVVINVVVWGGDGRREIELGEADPHAWAVGWSGGAVAT